MARLVRVGAHQHRHQVGADRMGDPGLVAVDLPDLAVPRPRGSERGEVGAGIRLGEHGGRQDLARRDAGQEAASSAPRCRRRGSAPRRSRSGCRGSRRRYRRGRVPRRRRTSRPSTGPCRRIPPGWSGRRRRARPSSRSPRAGCRRCRGATHGHAASPPPRRSGASRCGSPRASRRGRHRRSSLRPARRGSARRAGPGSPACCPRRSGPRPRRCGTAPPRAAESPSAARRTISPWLIGMPEKIWSRYSPSPIRTSSSSVSPKRPSRRQALRIGRSSRTASA